MSTSQNDDNLDEGFEDLDAAPGDTADNAPVTEDGDDALAAPSRSMTSGGGSKKNLFILLGLVAVLVLGGGGAYMFLMGGDDAAPAPVASVPAAAAPSEATFAAPVDPSAAPVDAAATPPMPDPAAPPDALAAAPDALPGLDAPAADPAFPADLAAAPPADFAAASPADLGAPPAEENVAMPLDTATPSDMTQPVDAAAVPPADATAAAPVTPALNEPQPDLPMPEQSQVPATTTTTTITEPAGTQPASTNTTSYPNAAELAIVQNAAILDQVTQPGTVSRPFDPSAPTPSQTNAIKEVDRLLQQEAIIRPLPPAWLQVSKNRDAGDMDSRLTAARSALAQNRNSAALQLFTELKTKYPKDYRVLMGRAVALQKLGQNDEALGAYQEVLVANPKNLEALTNMLGLLKGNDPQLAVAKLTELHETYPYQADITAQLGVAHGQAGDYAQALRYLDMAEAMDPGSAYILYNKAVLHDKMGHATQAGDLYRQLIRMAADGTLDENLPLEQIKRRLSVLR
jgi:Flp pilus assembly protein TadD